MPTALQEGDALLSQMKHMSNRHRPAELWKSMAHTAEERDGDSNVTCLLCF